MASAPDATSSDYAAMLADWDLAEVLTAGRDAVIAAGQTYLPKFPNESTADYDYRLTNAKFTNIYGDIVSNLAAKPFAEEVQLDEAATSRLKALAEDIDGRGNNLHVFAASTFFDGINNAIDWIMVEYTKARPRADGQALSRDEERSQGLRPYWVRIPAKRMLAVYTDVIGGKEIFVHARIQENITRRVGYSEETLERVRVLNREPIVDEAGDILGYGPATFELWEKRQAARKAAAWVPIDAGPITIGVIPIVPFITGRRIGGSWRLIPPMRAAAHLQIEHYQQETALKGAKETVAYPMLAGNGVQPALNADGTPATVPVGPKAVLYAPPTGESGQHGEWKYVNTDAEGLQFLAEEVKNTEQQLRELGRQPLTAQTGNLTVVTTAFAAQKGNSAIQAWALNLKDALEQAFVLTCQWINETATPTVRVFTDFALETGDDKGPDALQKMRENGDLSQETLWEEARRRNILSADFDPDTERQRLLDEAPDPDTAADMADALPGDQQAAA